MIITFREAQALGIWEIIAKQAGISLWASNEGLLDPDEPLSITIKEKEESK